MVILRGLCTSFRAKMGRVRGKVLEICEKVLILRKSAGTLARGANLSQCLVAEWFNASNLAKSGRINLMARWLAARGAYSVTLGGAGRRSESN